MDRKSFASLLFAHNKYGVIFQNYKKSLKKMKIYIKQIFEKIYSKYSAFSSKAHVFVCNNTSSIFKIASTLLQSLNGLWSTSTQISKSLDLLLTKCTITIHRSSLRLPYLCLRCRLWYICNTWLLCSLFYTLNLHLFIFEGLFFVAYRYCAMDLML
jgi:hypothetical protein